MATRSLGLLLLVGLLARLTLLGPASAAPDHPEAEPVRMILLLWDGTQRNHFLDLYYSGHLPNLQAPVEDGGLLRTDLVIHTETCEAGSGDGYRTQTGPANAAIITGYGYPEQGNQSLTQYAAAPFFLYLHYAQPDALGHAFGENSAEYNQALVSNDLELGRLVSQLTGLGIREQTRIVVTTDHGFEEDGIDHFDCIADDLDLWIAADRAVLIAKTGVDAYQTSIGPTLFDIFGLDKNVSPSVPSQSLYDDGKPPVPALQPTENADGDGSYLVQWSQVPDAETYSLQESPTPGFVEPITRYAGPDLQVQVTDQPAGTWYYRVRASNSVGDSPWSAAQSTLVFPDPPDLFPIANPGEDGDYLVDWSEVTGALTYTLEEDSASGFPLPTVRYSGPASQMLVTGQPTGTWYYRVRAFAAPGFGPWSDTESVQVGIGTYLPIMFRDF